MARIERFARLKLEIRNPISRDPQTWVTGAKRQLTNCLCPLKELKRFHDLPARRAGFGEVLQSDSQREVIRCESSLTDLEYASPELFG